MSEAAAQKPVTTNQQLQRFFRTPKGLLVLALGLLLIVAGMGAGVTLVLPTVAGATAAAMLVDLPVLRYREGEWQFPSGALLTGLIVAMVLSPYQPWYIAPVASAGAVLSKYLARTRSANVFNPAALALLFSFWIFHSPQSWWGALPELPLPFIVFLFATGIFIADRVNKMPSVVSFLGVYYLLFTLAAFLGDPGHVAGIFRAPDLHAALFFAFFMITDPPTSPPKQRDQIVFGVAAAGIAFVVYEVWHWVAFLIIGLLIANVWEAWRRGYHRRARARRNRAELPA